MRKIKVDQIKCFCSIIIYNDNRILHSCSDECNVPLRVAKCTINSNLNKYKELSGILAHISNKIS